MPSSIAATLPPFDKLDAKELQVLDDLIVVRTFAPGEIIFVEGERSEGLWFIHSGRVRIYKSSPGGRELTLCLAHARNQFCMGTCPLFDDEVNPGTAQAVEAATLLFIHRQKAMARAAASPAVGRALGAVLADRYRHFSRLATGLALRCTQSRVAQLLLEYADMHGRETGAGIELDMDLNQEMLASLVGADRTMVARTLATFQRRGILALGRPRVVISNRKKLEEAR